MFQARAFALGFMLVTGCAAEPTPPAEYPPIEAPPAATQATEPEAVAPPAEPPAPPPPPPPIQVVAGETAAIEGPAPTIAITAPRNDQVIKTETVALKLALETWALSPQGNHVHVIVDDEPYIAVRDVQAPIDLRALVQKELGHDLAEGTHVLRVFPSRGHHESVKEPGAFAVAVFHFKKKSSDFKWSAKAPLLTYSRPKGCVDLGQRVLVDFYVTNTKLSPTDSRVRLSIDGQLLGNLVQWQPHFIENLPEGEHQLRLSLADAKDAPVAGPFNDTTRTIQIRKDCKATTPAAPETPAAAPRAATPAQPTPAAPTTP